MKKLSTLFNKLCRFILIISISFSAVLQSVYAIPMRVLETGSGEITQNYDGLYHHGVDVVREGYLLDSIVAHSDGYVTEIIDTCDLNTPDDPTNPGNMIKISHDNGYSTRYLHLAYGSITVDIGDYVHKGDLLGYMGNTGNSFGGHLHFEVIKDGEKINPTDYLTNDLPSPVKASPTIQENNSNPSIYYRVKTKDSGWLPAVQDLTDYAGYANSAITDVAIKVNEGTIKYRVHLLNGDWLPYVTGYDINDYYNGYAGSGQVIDAIEAYYYTAPGAKPRRVKYAVNDYPYQYDNEVGGGQDGYAGAFGHPITKLVMTLE